jgi:hypothetical protein
MYEGHNLCPELAVGQVCFRVKTYNDGIFESVFHEHVPSHRISQDNAIEALRSLVARYSEWPGTFILHSLLNERRGKPSRYPGFVSHTSYPEPGVIRHYISAPRAHAWYDSIISKAKFRPASSLPESSE